MGKGGLIKRLRERLHSLKKDAAKNYCFICGHEVIWNSTFDAHDVSDDYDENDPAMCNYYHCPNCGADYEVIDPPQNERNTYPFWNKNNDNENQKDNDEDK